MPRSLSFARNDGFTLAEVLITLVIIGVIAAITVPTLIAKYREQQTVTKLKKAYSTISQAFNRARMDDPNVAGWTDKTWNTCDSAKDIADRLKPYIAIMKDEGCTTNNTRFYISTKFLNGEYYETLSGNGYYIFNMQDGITILIRKSNPTNTPTIFSVLVATQGEKTFKKPITGKNLFSFYADNTSIKPHNISSCGKSKNGNGCSAWVLTHENMDYPD